MRRAPRLLSVILLSLLAGCANEGKGRMPPTQATGSCDKPGAGAGAGAGAAAGATVGLATGPAAVIVSPAFALIGALIGAMAGSKSWCPDVAAADQPTSTGAVAGAAATEPRDDPSSIAASTAPNQSASAPPAASVNRQLNVRGTGACAIVGQPAGESDYQALRQDLDQCWQARIAVAQGLCDKNLALGEQICHAAHEARKYRADALAAFDDGWKHPSSL